MRIRTILGDIHAGELGVTTCHEHLLWRVPQPYTDEDADLGFDSVPVAIAELENFKSAGGNALVEMTTAEIGRRPKELEWISLRSGVHIIAASGHHKDKFSAQSLHNRSVNEIAERIIAEITVGIDQTGLKAGIIKAATSYDVATESELRVIQAVGIAHQATGAPVGTHTEAGTFAIQQADLLLQAGVVAEKLLIGHLDRGLNIEIYLELAGRGVYLGLDQIGKEKYWPDIERVNLIKTLIDSGYSQQLLLSTDSARKSSWHTYNPNAIGLAYLFVNFLPALSKAGISERTIEQIMIDNPARFLGF
jgi:phosphotriesterase-related protein